MLDSLSPGGTETSTVALAGQLRSAGHDVRIVVLRAEQTTLDPEGLGVPVTVLRPGSALSQTVQLTRLLRSLRPDLVHTALFHADQIGRIAGRFAGVPVVSSLVNTPYDAARLADPRFTAWKVRVVQVVDAITARLCTVGLHAVSAGVGRANALALRYPSSRVRVAERGRDAYLLGSWTHDRRSRVRESLGVAPGDEVLLSLGRLDRQKNHVGLIEAVELLDRPSVVVLIAGKDGSASDDVATALDARPAVAERVRLLGHRTDAADLLCATDVLVISSSIEGTAGVAIEAKALMCPVVSTRLAGLDGVLTDGVDAVLCEPGSPTALAEAITTVLDDPALRRRMAAAGYDDFQRRFTLPAAAERMAALYRDVARGRRGWQAGTLDQ